MRFIKRLYPTLVFIAFMGLLSPSFAAAPTASDKDLALNGDAKCTRCHDESEATPLLSIGKTKHGTRADTRTPTCTSCHGDSEKHLHGDAKGRAAPERVFKKGAYAVTAVDIRNNACLTCHEKDARRSHWDGSTHQTQGVACNSCHQSHGATDKVRDKRTQADVCFTCHKEQRAQSNRPSHHPIAEGKVSCSDCHNPHGSAGPKLLAKDSVVRTCYECHMEKRGPFLHEHPPVMEDCTLCHNPHGTAAASLLKQRVPLLCNNCHNEGSHHSNFQNQLAARATPATGQAMGSGCLLCHTKIHGSNTTQSGNQRHLEN